MSAGRDSLQAPLLSTLRALLQLPALDLGDTLMGVAHHVALVLNADKVDAFLIDDARQSLVALGTSDTPLGRLQKALGLDVLPLANGGRAVDAFQLGQTFVTGRADADPGELRGIVGDLGIRSVVNVPLHVNEVRRGVLSVTSQTPDFFNEGHRAFLEVVAECVGAIAHRAALVAQSRRTEAESARRAAADEVVTVLAHDLRNHLNPLLGRLHVMKLKAADGRPIESDDIEAALRSVQRIARLTSDLLDIGRLDQGLFSLSLDLVDAAKLVRHTSDALSTPNVPIHVSGPDELLLVADADRLSQALENVVANAVRHSPPANPVHVSVTTRGEAAQIQVIDSGPGIAPEILPRLFQRFMAGRGSEGLGLGLYLAQRIARAHGGSLNVESTPGAGSRFTFELPLSAAPLSERAPHP